MRRSFDALLVPLFASRLDAELAGGKAPESSPRHAIRARQLTAPHCRSELAQSWERLLQLAHTAPGGLSTRAPIRRERIHRAEPEIRGLIDALRVNGPVPAQGVALARRLLGDGTGPLYNPRAAEVLEELLGRAVEHLDPALPLTADLPLSAA